MFHGSCSWQKQIGGHRILTAFDAVVAAAVRARLGRWFESMIDRGDGGAGCTGAEYFQESVGFYEEEAFEMGGRGGRRFSSVFSNQAT